MRNEGLGGITHPCFPPRQDMPYDSSTALPSPALPWHLPPLLNPVICAWVAQFVGSVTRTAEDKVKSKLKLPVSRKGSIKISVYS